MYFLLSDNVVDPNVLQFKVNTGVKYQGALEANSADILILIKKKRGSRIRTRKGKRIFIKIYQYDSNDQTSSSLKLVTALRTRIKNTRWQKISLPISLAQQVLESENGMLRLKVECRQCGKKIRPVLLFEGRGRRKRRPKSSLVRLSSDRPFLVISPRMKSYFGWTWIFYMQERYPCNACVVRDGNIFELSKTCIIVSTIFTWINVTKYIMLCPFNHQMNKTPVMQQLAGN